MRDIEELGVIRSARLARDSQLIRSYLRKNIKKDFAELHPNLTLKPFKSDVVHVVEDSPQSSSLPTFPLLSVVADALPDRHHAFAVIQRRVSNNRQVPLVCEALRASINPILYLRGLTNSNVDSSQFNPMEENDGYSRSHGVIMPADWHNRARIASALRAEKTSLEERKKYAQSQIQKITKTLKLFGECIQALSQASNATERGVLEGSNTLRSQSDELASTRRRARTVVFLRDREVVRKKKHIADLESELDLANEAIKDRQKSGPDQRKRMALVASDDEDAKPLPTAAWSEEQLTAFVASNQGKIRLAQEAILHAESKAEVSKEKLLRLITESEQRKEALRKSNVLQLVVMDGIRDARRQIDSEQRKKEKHLRQCKARNDTLSLDLKEVCRAITALGVSDVDKDNHLPAADAGRRLPNWNGDAAFEDSRSDQDFLSWAEATSKTVNEHGDTMEQLPFDEAMVPCLTRTELGITSAPQLGATSVLSMQSDDGVSMALGGALSFPRGGGPTVDLFGVDDEDDEFESSETGKRTVHAGIGGVRGGTGERESSLAFDGPRDPSVTDAPSIDSPRIIMDDGPERSFEQELLDRYQEALGALFADERTELVELQNQAAEQNAQSEAELLEMQKEFGLDPGEERKRTEEGGDEKASHGNDENEEVPQDPKDEEINDEEDSSTDSSFENTGRLGQQWESIMVNETVDYEETFGYEALSVAADPKPPKSITEALVQNNATEPEFQYTFGNFGESGDETSTWSFEDAEAQDARRSERFAIGIVSGSNNHKDAVGSSVSMKFDDPPPANNTEALIYEEMTAEERVVRRLKATDSFLEVAGDQEAAFEEAEYQVRIQPSQKTQEETEQANVSIVGAKSLETVQETAGEVSEVAQKLSAATRREEYVEIFESQKHKSDETHANSVPGEVVLTPPSIAAAGQTRPSVLTPASLVGHVVEASPVQTIVELAPSAMAPVPEHPIDKAAIPAVRTSMEPSQTDSNNAKISSDVAVERERSIRTQRHPHFSPQYRLNHKEAESDVELPKGRDSIDISAPLTVSQGSPRKALTSEEGDVEEEDEEKATSHQSQKLMILSEPEPGLTELTVEGAVDWTDEIVPRSDEFGSRSEDEESRIKSPNQNLGPLVGDDKSNQFRLHRWSQQLIEHDEQRKKKKSHGSGDEAKRANLGTKRESDIAVAEEDMHFRAAPQKIPELKQTVPPSSVGRPVGREGIRCIGRTIESRGARRDTKNRLAISNILIDESKSYGASGLARARSAPLLDAELNSTFSLVSSSSSVPYLDGAKEDDTDRHNSPKSITDAIPAINLATFGSEPPDMTDEQFVQWMDDFISVATQASPEDEEILRDFMSRQRAARSRPCTGISGLNARRSEYLSDGTELLRVTGDAPFQPEVKLPHQDSRCQPLPEIQLSKGMGVKLVRSDDGGYTYRYYKQRLAQAPRAADSRRSGKVTHTSVDGAENMTRRPAPSALSSAAVKWDIRSQSRAPQFQLANPVDSMSSNKFKQLTASKPTLTLAGESLKLPGVKDAQAARLTWSKSMPPLMSGLSSADKDLAWRSFKGSSISRATMTAYAELSARPPSTAPKPEIDDGARRSALPAVAAPALNDAPKNVLFSREALSHVNESGTLRGKSYSEPNESIPILHGMAFSREAADENEVHVALALEAVLSTMKTETEDFWDAAPADANRLSSHGQRRHATSRRRGSVDISMPPSEYIRLALSKSTSALQTSACSVSMLSLTGASVKAISTATRVGDNEVMRDLLPSTTPAQEKPLSLRNATSNNGLEADGDADVGPIPSYRPLSPVSPDIDLTGESENRSVVSGVIDLDAVLNNEQVDAHTPNMNRPILSLDTKKTNQEQPTLGTPHSQSSVGSRPKPVAEVPSPVPPMPPRGGEDEISDMEFDDTSSDVGVEVKEDPIHIHPIEVSNNETLSEHLHAKDNKEVTKSEGTEQEKKVESSKVTEVVPIKAPKQHKKTAPKKGSGKNSKRSAASRQSTDEQQTCSPWMGDETLGEVYGQVEEFTTLEAILSEAIDSQPLVQVRKQKKKYRAKVRGKKLPWNLLSDDEIRKSDKMERALALSKAASKKKIAASSFTEKIEKRKTDISNEINVQFETMRRQQNLG